VSNEKKTEAISGGILERRGRGHQCTPPDIKKNKIEEGDRFVCACCQVWHCSRRLKHTAGFTLVPGDLYWRRAGKGDGR
jgi:hypothetical protein